MADWANLEKGFDVKQSGVNTMPSMSNNNTNNTTRNNGGGSGGGGDNSKSAAGTDTKPFKCPHCVRAFANNSYLTQHMRIHLGLKPFGPCQYCERRFTQLSHLQQHVRTHTGEKPYRCKYTDCDKTFSQLSNLQSHSRCHQNDKPFKCNACYKCFNDEGSLLEHIPKHKESKHLKVHICSFCGKSYTQSLYLEKHMSRHADRRETRTNVCNSKYTTEYTNFPQPATVAPETFDSINQLSNLSQLTTLNNPNHSASLRGFQQQVAAVSSVSAVSSATATSISSPIITNGLVSTASIANYVTYPTAISNANHVFANPISLDFINRSFQRETVPGTLRNVNNERPLGVGFNMITPLEDIKHFNAGNTTVTSFNNCA